MDYQITINDLPESINKSNKFRFNYLYIRSLSTDDLILAIAQGNAWNFSRNKAATKIKAVWKGYHTRILLLK
jgi:predicted metallo-beta-lactamase superfamily hydrolase